MEKAYRCAYVATVSICVLLEIPSYPLYTCSMGRRFHLDKKHMIHWQPSHINAHKQQRIPWAQEEHVWVMQSYTRILG